MGRTPSDCPVIHTTELEDTQRSTFDNEMDTAEAI